MKTKPLVSIIVPSFNVEQYFRRCLDSIKAQTYENWECIIVDRPSTKDNTTFEIKKYIKDDVRFRFIEQVNKGVSDGRNVGFAAAKGEYVQFTDPDDWLSPDLLEHSVRRAQETNAEIVQFAWSNYYIQTGLYIDAAFMPYAQKFPELFSVADHGDEIFKYGEIHINSMSKLWRRDFLESQKMKFPQDLKRAEDLAEVSRLVMRASRITYLDEVLYYYKIDEFLGDSLSNFVSDDGHNLDFYKAILVVHDNMEEQGLLPKLKDGFCRVAITNSLHALYMSKFSIAANQDIYNCICTKVFPMIASELNKINPEMYELFSTQDYNAYLEKQMKQAYLENQEKERRIIELNEQNSILHDELAAHHSIKRSTKLTLGNIKRRIIKRK